MARLSLFKDDTAQDIWIEANCVVRKCYRQPTCPILARALARDRKPREWDRNSRATTMASVYRCNAFGEKAPKPVVRKDFEDVPMFEVDVKQLAYVPVEDWPDKPVRHNRKDDHA